ncbi:hypothetical protein SeMB42_g01590 [Synchytrium endobioticum]|uniref:Mitochondrial carrier n=1 Tax=Synchytrium endobioticum TaxID=286115 RepID=A0A507DKK7_9FUNG|nr:hypothetical protein SeLEV6574_g04058 [Synchytrium endobioticum]TPX52184.1 hypothetical protein SeMB42_g01590 [Synchytrium endobioticum]
MPSDLYIPYLSSLLNQLSDVSRVFKSSSGADKANDKIIHQNGSYTGSNASALGPSSSDFSGFALQHYTLSVILSPLQVAETLTQVQYWKREESLPPDGPASADEEDLPLGAEAASYYDEGDAISISTSRQQPRHHPRLPLLQSGLFDDWKNIIEHPDEGWTALLKGHVTSFLESMAFAVFQPSLEETLNDFFDVYDDVHLITLTMSHIIVGAILSPLELIKTRIIVQASLSNRKKYHNPIHAASVIAAEENGTLSALYSSRHLFPSITLHAMRPLLRYASTAVMEANLGLSIEYTPILYFFGRLAFLAGETLLLTPLEFAKRRLECQRLGGRNVGYYGSRGSQYGGSQSGSQHQTPSQYSHHDNEWMATPIQMDVATYAMPFDAAVDLAPFKYRGMWDVLYTVVATESESNSSPSSKRRRPSYSGTSFAGIPAATRDIEWTQIHRLSPSRPTPQSIINDPWLNQSSARRHGDVSPSRIDTDVASITGGLPTPPTSTPMVSWGTWVGNVGGGVKTLYRGFWPRYIQTIIVYVFDEINRMGEDDLF